MHNLCMLYYKNDTMHEPFAELLEGWSDDGVLADDAVAADPDVGQVSTDDGVRLYDHFTVEDNVLRAAQHCLPTHLVP